MVASALPGLPRSKALNVRAGLALLALGLAVAFWSFSGNQAYDLKFFYLAVVSTAVGLFGAVLLANSRVVSQKRRAHPKAQAPREWVRLECPRCSAAFEVEGERPFTAVCPSCGSSGLVE